MKVYIYTEPLFDASSVCNAAFGGLKHCLKKKRIEYVVINSTDEINPNTNGNKTFLVIISTSMPLISKCVVAAEKAHVHPIIISTIRPQLPHHVPYSYVTINSRHYLSYMLSYLKSINKTSPVFFGVSRQSLPDTLRRNMFYDSKIFNADETDVIYNSVGLLQSFEEFKTKLDKFDCALCPNACVAIFLSKSLSSIGIDPATEFPIISLGSSKLASQFHPEIISSPASSYYNVGKAAVTICETLASNDELVHMSLSLKNKPPFEHDVDFLRPEEELTYQTESEIDIFYKDPSVKEMLIIENMLNSFSESDETIFNMLLNDCSYESIAESQFISLSTVKYRVRRMLHTCGCANRSDFTALLKKYI